MIRSVAVTRSTNDDMALLARAGAAEGSWLRADHQTNGRGRQGRPWEAASGNLYASTLVRLLPGDPSPPGLALVAAVALDAVLLPLTGQERLRIKWPNDLMLDGGKLSGILLEREHNAIIIGFGVNLSHAPEIPDRATSSLAGAGLATISPEDMVVELAASFAHMLAIWRQQGTAEIVARWARRCFPVGTPLRVTVRDGEQVDGLFDGMALDGALRLRLADGRVETIHAGDVFLV